MSGEESSELLLSASLEPSFVDDLSGSLKLLWSHYTFLLLVLGMSRTCLCFSQTLPSATVRQESIKWFNRTLAIVGLEEFFHFRVGKVRV